MNCVIRHIEYLISRKDCVIIPGLGAVLAHYASAAIDVEASCIMPPKRVYSFNTGLTQSDGTLACSLSRAEGISYEKAASKVAKEVDAMVQQLHHDGEMPLGRIGILSYDSADNLIQFIPFEGDRLSALTAWLPSVRMPVAEQVAPIPQLPAVEPYVRQSHLRRFSRIAAFVALFIGICFVVSTPISIDDAALASLYPQISPITAADLSLDTAKTEAAPAPVDIVIDEPIATQEEVAEPQEPAIEAAEPQEPAIVPALPQEIQQPEAAASEGNYLIIVSSLASMADAEKYLSRAADPSLKIYVKDSKYRVYCAAFETSSQAYAALAQMQKTNANLWVCKR